MIQGRLTMRVLPFLLPLVALAACQRGGSADPNQQAMATPEDDGRVECRIGADREYNRFCTLERSRTEQGLLLTIHKPDGGFRRLIDKRDGRGVVAADGAEQAQVQIVGTDKIEVAIGGDTFRLPARIGPVPQTRQ
jgi:hypothetical protein